MTKLTTLVVAWLALAGCKDKGAAGAGDAKAALAKMTELKEEMCRCKDPRCAEDVSKKMTAWSEEQAKSGKAPKMTEADQLQATALGQAMGKCMQIAMAAAPTEPSTGSAAAPGAEAPSASSGADGLPAACAEYKSTVEKLKTCDALPPKAKEVLVEAFEDAAAGWAAMPEGAKAGLGESCKKGTAALLEAAKEPCGW